MKKTCFSLINSHKTQCLPPAFCVRRKNGGEQYFQDSEMMYLEITRNNLRKTTDTISPSLITLLLWKWSSRAVIATHLKQVK